MPLKRIGNLDFSTASHCVYHLVVHVVFCTKFHRKILTQGISESLYTAIRIIAEEQRCQVLEIKGEADHLHFLLSYPPTIQLSTLISIIKSKSAQAILNIYGSFFYGYHSRTLWSSGYFVCSVGGNYRNLKTIHRKSRFRVMPLTHRKRKDCGAVASSYFSDNPKTIPTFFGFKRPRINR